MPQPPPPPPEEEHRPSPGAERDLEEGADSRVEDGDAEHAPEELRVCACAQRVAHHEHHRDWSPQVRQHDLKNATIILNQIRKESLHKSPQVQQCFCGLSPFTSVCVFWPDPLPVRLRYARTDSRDVKVPFGNFC